MQCLHLLRAQFQPVLGEHCSREIECEILTQRDRALVGTGTGPMQHHLQSFLGNRDIARSPAYVDPFSLQAFFTKIIRLFRTFRNIYSDNVLSLHLRLADTGGHRDVRTNVIVQNLRTPYRSSVGVLYTDHFPLIGYPDIDSATFCIRKRHSGTGDPIGCLLFEFGVRVFLHVTQYVIRIFIRL